MSNLFSLPYASSGYTSGGYGNPKTVAQWSSPPMVIGSSPNDTVSSVPSIPEQIKSPPSESPKPQSSLGWWGDFIMAIPQGIASEFDSAKKTVENASGTVTGDIQAAAHSTASGVGDAVNSVGAAASSTINHIGSGIDLAYKDATSTASKVLGTVEGGFTFLTMTPFLLILAIILLFVWKPEAVTKAGKTATAALL